MECESSYLVDHVPDALWAANRINGGDSYNAKVRCLEADLCDLSVAEELGGGRPKGVSLSAPCIPYSKLTKNCEDVREHPSFEVLLTSLILVAVLQPRVLLFENLPRFSKLWEEQLSKSWSHV